MSHGIILPIDKVISTKGTEWHGLANVAETITDEIVAPLLFKIVEGSVVVKIDNADVKMSNHKALVADYRECRPDLVDDEDTSSGLVPLHIPKNSYFPIPNAEVWDAMKKALKDVDAVVTSAGTLEAGKKFFLSATLGKDDKFKVNGDEFLANLNFITSHDGSWGVEAFDSNIRCICLNTVRWSREAAGDVGFKVYHSKNADFAMKNLGDLVNRVISGRADFKTSMQYLASVSVKSGVARNIIGGYFASLPTFDEKEGFSTRANNTIEEIHSLFANGIGNKGATLYDIFNAFTQYYTNGNGTGQKSDPLTKMYKATFGNAADHKNAITNALLSEERVKELAKLGKDKLV